MTETKEPTIPMPPALAAIVDRPGWEHGALGQHYYSVEEWIDIEVYPVDTEGGWVHINRTHPENDISTESVQRIASLLAELDKAVQG